MPTQKKKNAHLWDRNDNDWYVEPSVCSLALFDVVQFKGPVWDPACGMGRILKSAQVSGFDTIGSDVEKRTDDCDFLADFLSNHSLPEVEFDVVTNPPFAIAEDFVRKTIDILSHGRRGAFVLPIVWMAGFSSKRDWLPSSPLRYVLPISPRPSMPPGEVLCAGERPGNGTKDFAWFVWEKGFTGKPALEFLNTNNHKPQGVKIDKLLGDVLCERKVAA